MVRNEVRLDRLPREYQDKLLHGFRSCGRLEPTVSTVHKGCNITPRTSIGNISSISELIQPFPRSVYAEIDENSRNEVPMDVRGVMLQCLGGDAS